MELPRPHSVRNVRWEKPCGFPLWRTRLSCARLCITVAMRRTRRAPVASHLQHRESTLHLKPQRNLATTSIHCHAPVRACCSFMKLRLDRVLKLQLSGVERSEVNP